MIYLSPQAKEDAIALRLCDEDSVLERVSMMVKRAARCTHEMGNLRYHDLVFDVVETPKGMEVLQINLRQPRTCQVCFGTAVFTQFDPCPICEGSGCNACGNMGGAVEEIPCQHCKSRR